jgi:hypothetical protein
MTDWLVQGLIPAGGLVVIAEDHPAPDELIRQGFDVVLRMHGRGAMPEEGVVLNAGTRTRFKLWHRDDPARPLDLNAVDPTPSPQGSPVASGVDGGEERCGAVGYVVPTAQRSADTPDCGEAT